MGDILLTPDPSTTETQITIAMSFSSETPKIPKETLTQETETSHIAKETRIQEIETPVQENQQDPKTLEPSKETKQNQEGEEDEGECPFCLYMKAGECREAFIEWEKCVEEGDKNNEDIVAKCHDITAALTKCMEAHPDHYGPILNVEKAAREEAMEEMEKEKAEMETRKA